MAASAQKITISPVTRIEGHAKITLHLDEAGRLAVVRRHTHSSDSATAAPSVSSRERRFGGCRRGASRS